MKKQLLEDLKQIAQKILWSSKVEDLAKLKGEVGDLYEKLTVLEYLEKQLSGDFKRKAEESLDSKSYREHNWFKDPEPVPEPEIKDEIIEPATEKIKDLVAQMPHESQEVDALLEEVLPKPTYIKNDLEEFASHYQETPVFERKESIETAPKTDSASAQSATEEPEKPTKLNDVVKATSLNEVASQKLTLALNDRIAFTNQLFEGNNEDFSRVISQLNTFNTFDEAHHFIVTQVKPEYNYWLKSETVAQRFMDWVERQF